MRKRREGERELTMRERFALGEITRKQWVETLVRDRKFVPRLAELQVKCDLAEIREDHFVAQRAAILNENTFRRPAPTVLVPTVDPDAEGTVTLAPIKSPAQLRAEADARAHALRDKYLADRGLAPTKVASEKSGRVVPSKGTSGPVKRPTGQPTERKRVTCAKCAALPPLVPMNEKHREALERAADQAAAKGACARCFTMVASATIHQGTVTATMVNEETRLREQYENKGHRVPCETCEGVASFLKRLCMTCKGKGALFAPSGCDQPADALDRSTVRGGFTAEVFGGPLLSNEDATNTIESVDGPALLRSVEGMLSAGGGTWAELQTGVVLRLFGVTEDRFMKRADGSLGDRVPGTSCDQCVKRTGHADKSCRACNGRGEVKRAVVRKWFANIEAAREYLNTTLSVKGAQSAGAPVSCPCHRFGRKCKACNEKGELATVKITRSGSVPVVNERAVKNVIAQIDNRVSREEIARFERDQTPDRLVPSRDQGPVMSSAPSTPGWAHTPGRYKGKNSIASITPYR